MTTAVPAPGKFVSYLRVSTDRQGKSGLGLEAQRKAVEDFLNGGHWELIAEFVEVETGKNDDRPMLRDALLRAKVTGATVVIAKLDRLSRNLAFIATLQDSGARFLAADMPEANETMIQFMAVIAQHERKMISARTKAALTAAKARGQKLGTPNLTALQAAGAGKPGWTAGADARRRLADEHARNILPIIEAIRAEGITSLGGIARALSEKGILTALGGRWDATRVRKILRRSPGDAEPIS
jgi:DNA invertase Pin-like site-specific DNA recombinase